MRIISTLIGLALSANMMAQTTNPIRVNQVGYYPSAPKSASVAKSGWSSKYVLTDASTGRRVWTGKAVRKATSPWSGKQWAVVDFSSVTQPGEYLLSNGKGSEQKVVVKEHALADLSRGAMKAFYWNRCSQELVPEHAGKFARAAGHPDTRVLVHPSAATASRPAGTVISSPGGWYDAGDFNKYIVNASFSVGLMLCAYEAQPDAFNSLELNIPESKNNTPDFLDEIMHELRWMQTMQDPGDGGVYSKLTTAQWEWLVMPSQCTDTRYVVSKGTTAALDFAAAMAQAARIYGKLPQWQTWAAVALVQAEKAYEWALEHPDVVYDQDDLNRNFDPDIITGYYERPGIDDEWLWASTELWLTTGKEQYRQQAERYKTMFRVPTWPDVAGLAMFSLANANQLEDYRKLLINFADDVASRTVTSCFQSPYGNVLADFDWGGLSNWGAGMGITLLYAYKLTDRKDYLTGALQVADYLLGRNATGYCYVTGFGTHSPEHPHLGVAASDGIDETLPGFLVGGPNPGQEDAANCKTYPSKWPDESYTDDVESYAANEVCINWNASLVALIAWLDHCMANQKGK